MRITSVLPTLLLLPIILIGSMCHAANLATHAGLCHSSLSQLESYRGIARRKKLQEKRDWVEGLLLKRGARIAFVGHLRSTGALKIAADAWNSGLGENLFHLSASPRQANITVRLVDHIQGGNDLQGEVVTNDGVGSNGVVHAQISVCDNSDGRRLSQQEIAEVIAHELGHLLGLDDSPTGEGLMGGFDPNAVFVRPSVEELLAVRYLRSKVVAELD